MEETVTFRLALHGTRGKREEWLLVNRPTTVQDLKKAIEDQFAVPVSCQMLYFGSVLLLESVNIGLCQFRDDDVLHLHYDTEADTKEILEAINCFGNILTEVQLTQQHLIHSVRSSDHLSDSVDLQPLINELANVEYFPRRFMIENENYVANMVFFIERGGVQLVQNTLIELLKIPWHHAPFSIRVLEKVITEALHALCYARNYLSLPVLQQSLELACSSLLQFQIHKKEHLMADHSEPFGMLTPDFQVVYNVIFRAANIILR